MDVILIRCNAQQIQRYVQSHRYRYRYISVRVCLTCKSFVGAFCLFSRQPVGAMFDLDLFIFTVLLLLLSAVGFFFSN